MSDVIIDTNVFLRHLLQDIPTQSPLATELIEEIERGEKVGLISILTMNELIWMLEKYYRLQRNNYIPQILKILFLDSMKSIEIKKEMLIKILERMQKRKIDFTDIYLFEIAEGRTIVSFDKDFEKLKN